MGPQDPYAPYPFTWPPPEWNTSPDPIAPPPAPGPSADPYYNPNEPEPIEGGGAPTLTLNPESNTYQTPDGKNVFPLGQAYDQNTHGRPGYQPMPQPRDDMARIAQATGPIGTVQQIGKDVDPAAQKQPAIGELPTFTPEEMAQVGQAPPPYIGYPRPDLGTMPDDFVGGPSNLSFTEMPEEFAGRELGPQDPYGDVASGPAADASRALAAGVDKLGSAVAKVPNAVDSRAPGMPDEYLSDEELGQKLAGMPLEQQEMERAKIEGARQRFASARMLEASEKAQRNAEENARIYQDSIKAAQMRSAELDAEAQNLARKNPLDSITGSQKVFGVLASIVGGWAANKTGRNMGLEIVDQIANEAAANHAQKLALNARQQGAVGDQVSRAQDAYKAAETMRIATYDGAIKSLETEVQNFDPRGTTALRVMDQINALRAKRAELLAKYTTEQQKRMEAILKEQRELAQLQETQRHNMAAERADATRAGADWLRAKTDEKKAAKEIAGDDAKSRKAEADAVEAEAKAAAAKSGFAIADPETGNAFTQKDGTPFVVMDAEERKRVRGITTAALNIRRLADKIEEVRKKTGGGSTILGTDDAQELQSLAKAVDFETYKAFDLGAPSAGDQEMAHGIRGGVDITSFLKDPKKGLQTYADSVEKKALTHLRGAGYTGAAVRFRRSGDLGKTEPSVVDQVHARLTTAPARDLSLGGGQGGVNIDPKEVGKIFGDGTTPQKSDEVRAADNDLTILAAYAEQPKTATEAREALKDLAKNGISERVRAQAQAILDALPGAGERKGAAR